jgi:hypothetical protein
MGPPNHRGPFKGVVPADRRLLRGFQGKRISKDIFSWFDELRAKTSEAGPRENPVLWIELPMGSARFGAQKRDNDNLKIGSLRICRSSLWPGVATCTLNSFILPAWPTPRT